VAPCALGRDNGRETNTRRLSLVIPNGRAGPGEPVHVLKHAMVMAVDIDQGSRLAGISAHVMHELSPGTLFTPK